MSMFMDLNVMFSADRSRLQALIETAAHLGFSTVAINYVFEPTAKKKQRPSAAEYRRFDLLAVQPTSEKLFHAACTSYDIDIICVPVTDKLPFFFKRAPVNGAIDRGVVFEVSYSAALRDSTLRRYTIANAVALMDVCKGKNVILSSGAEKALELRGPYDITNLGLLFGLSDRDSKEAVSSTCRAVLLHAETRRTASGIIYTSRLQQEALQDSDHGEAPAAKRPKTTPPPPPPPTLSE
ncbi:ribonuclease P protein subunit p30 isoform X2 [Mugil cephalus]|uniref:ribonuclease P protein subunit p30 isoform X2 n=1 Tax=Mugil cephalus TaxID=48193 RepID=UPI001FB79C5C|nr:ribonuclease P protein subunit p30 isoform X2 [Mugil cephalus]